MPAPGQPLSAELLARICEVVDQFDAAWQEVAKGSPRPSLEDALQDVPPQDQTAFFRELLAVELKCRQCFGEQPTSEIYYLRFPQSRELIDDVFR